MKTIAEKLLLLFLLCSGLPAKGADYKVKGSLTSAK